jgi:hypothetical protein
VISDPDIACGKTGIEMAKKGKFDLMVGVSLGEELHEYRLHHLGDGNPSILLFLKRPQRANVQKRGFS